MELLVWAIKGHQDHYLGYSNYHTLQYHLLT